MRLLAPDDDNVDCARYVVVRSVWCCGLVPYTTYNSYEVVVILFV